MLRPHTRVVEAGRHAVGLENLSLGILKNAGAGSVKKSRSPADESCSVSFGVETQPCRLHTEELDGSVLQKAIEDAPDETFGKVAKKTALNLVGDCIKDIAKGKIKEAAKEIVALGVDLGPVIAKTAAYAFFSQLGG